MQEGILKFLGNDSGFGENNNSAYWESDEELVIIDCGYTVFNKIKNKFDFNKYNTINIIITHLHNDHAGSLSQFILYMWFIYKKKINVICNCKNIKQYLEITGTPDESYVLKSKLSNLEFIKTEHTKFLDSYGFKMKIGNKIILYTGDTCNIENFISYIEDVNELYIDLSKFGGVHLKIDNIINILKELKKKNIKIIPMHMDDKNYILDIISRIN